MLNIQRKTSALEIEDIVNYYKNNIKRNDFKIGLEWEKLSLDKNSLENAKYENLKKIIEAFAHIKKWGILKDENTIIGAWNGKSSISLEPGGQFELSLVAHNSLDKIKNEANEIWKILSSIAKSYNIIFTPLGLTPQSTFKNIDFVPKKRYLIMNDYFQNFGDIGYPVMMKETAGVQVNIDYKSEEDAFVKLKAISMISPYLTGFFANSIMRDGKNTGYKSFRAKSWLNVDNKRCGFFYKNLFKYPTSVRFEDYIKYILDIPMLYIEREDKKILIKDNRTFKQFMHEGYENYVANLQDYILHSSLTFPDIRLKNCLEIRNHDSQNLDMTLSICAFYKGILSKREQIDTILDMFDYTKEELDELKINSAKFGLSFKYKGRSAFDTTKKLFEMALDGLEPNEKIYLLKPLKMLEDKKCVADIMLSKNLNCVYDVVNLAMI